MLVLFSLQTRQPSSSFELPSNDWVFLQTQSKTETKCQIPEVMASWPWDRL